MFPEICKLAWISADAPTDAAVDYSPVGCTPDNPGR